MNRAVCLESHHLNVSLIKDLFRDSLEESESLSFFQPEHSNNNRLGAR